MTALLVDDEISSLKLLQQKVRKLFPELDILGIFQIPEDAIKFIKKTPPDILFLDVQMPRMNGFEFLSSLKVIEFQVIFVTAYSEYALKAFKQSAVDYILKPIEDHELQIAINKAFKIIELKEQHENHTKLIDILTETITGNNKLIIPTIKGLSFIPQDEVIHLEGYDGYTKIHMVLGGEIVSSYNLGKFEKTLKKVFFKCHKSHIVNLEKVRSFENEGYLVLENDNRVPISKANKKAFLKMFR